MVRNKEYYNVEVYDVDPTHVSHGLEEYNKDNCTLLATQHMSNNCSKLVKIDRTYMYYEDGTKTFVKLLYRWDNNNEKWLVGKVVGLGGSLVAKEVQ